MQKQIKNSWLFSKIPRTVRSDLWVVISLLAILITRTALTLRLYQLGFACLTADEFGRPVLAAKWALHPTLLVDGWWLPHYMYLYGLALKIYWNLLWTPRFLTLLFGLASIVVVFCLTYQLTRNRWWGLASAILIAANPLHIWFSAVPLSDVPSWFLCLAFFAFLVLFINSRRIFALYLGAFCLFTVNGFRLETWVLSALFVAYLVFEGVVHFRANRRWDRTLTHYAACAFLALLFPLFWTGSSLIRTGTPFATLDIVSNYKANQYGKTVDFLAYPRAAWATDPLLAALIPFALVFGLFRFKKNHTMFIYSLIAIVFLLAFIAAHRGRTDPEITYRRYLAIYLYIFLPILMGLLDWLSSQIFVARWRLVLPLLLLCGYSFWHASGSFQFYSDASINGLRAGQYLKFLRKSQPSFTGKPVLIEQLYWDYLAIHVGANDMTQIYYDRKLGFSVSPSSSVFFNDPQVLRACISQLRFSSLIVRTPEAKSAIEKELGLPPLVTINEYSFYQVPDSLYALPEYEAVTCPLQIGTGY